MDMKLGKIYDNVFIAQLKDLEGNLYMSLLKAPGANNILLLLALYYSLNLISEELGCTGNSVRR